jgi:D-glycero-D-manno-heptose 1,7-bisphosphate phosphatase
MKESWMIGDSERDITAASLAGIKNTILVRSGHKIDEENSKAKYLSKFN